MTPNSNKTRTNCRLCHAITNYHHDIANTTLMETHSFKVMPAIGSLVIGYCMIVSKKHIPSMAHLTNEEIYELEQLSSYIRGRITSQKKSCILFEHGGTINPYSPCANTIDHAHIHIIPLQITQEGKLLNDLKPTRIDNLQTIRAYMGKNYILYNNPQNTIYISCRPFPSQYMRKWIANEIGIPNKWNWKQFPFTENIKKSIDYLNATI